MFLDWRPRKSDILGVTPVSPRLRWGVGAERPNESLVIGMNAGPIQNPEL